MFVPSLSPFSLPPSWNRNNFYFHEFYRRVWGRDRTNWISSLLPGANFKLELSLLPSSCCFGYLNWANITFKMFYGFRNKFRRKWNEMKGVFGEKLAEVVTLSRICETYFTIINLSIQYGELLMKTQNEHRIGVKIRGIDALNEFFGKNWTVFRIVVRKSLSARRTCNGNNNYLHRMK